MAKKSFSDIRPAKKNVAKLRATGGTPKRSFFSRNIPEINVSAVHIPIKDGDREVRATREKHAFVENIVHQKTSALKDVSMPTQNHEEVTHLLRTTYPFSTPQNNPLFPKLSRSVEASFPIENSRKKGRGIWKIILSLVVLLGFLVGAWFLPRFHQAKIEVTVRKERGAISGAFLAHRGAEKSGDISFDRMNISGEERVGIEATEERQVEEHASGSIVIVNTFSTAPQRLIKNTRFVTKEGKIFRIKESVVVPGASKIGDKTSAGTLEAFVYADEPGETYNIGLTDFTIPGFKGDPRHESIYALSKTEMTGGFIGTKRFPAERALSDARKELEARLFEKLKKAASGQRPSGFILYPSAQFISFAGEPEVSPKGDNTMELLLKGTLTGIIFNEQALTEFVAQKSIPAYKGNGVIIPELAHLQFSLREGDSPESDTIYFELAGDVSVQWPVNEGELKNALVGKPKKEFEGTLALFPNIVRASASVRPFFRSVFPMDPEKMRIIYKE